ncbi:hypothetical protein BTVI_83823 [Pitangus sulphuratus]|nr:hypothetical protein BTVI_83823 [Pitangus sulphuratus]
MFNPSVKCSDSESSRHGKRRVKGNPETSGQTSWKGWVKIKQVSEVPWKSLFREVMSYKKRGPDGKLAECAPLPKPACQEKEKSGIRRTEGDKK